MKCKNCKYWERDSDRYFGTCSNKSFITNGDISPTWGMQCFGDFETGEDFGCIHFEKIAFDLKAEILKEEAREKGTVAELYKLAANHEKLIELFSKPVKGSMEDTISNFGEWEQGTVDCKIIPEEKGKWVEATKEKALEILSNGKPILEVCEIYNFGSPQKCQILYMSMNEYTDTDKAVTMHCTIRKNQQFYMWLKQDAR